MQFRTLINIAFLLILIIGCNKPFIEPEVLTQEHPQSTTLKSAVIGNKYYVAKTGKDSNSGTLLSPFLTIQKGVDLAKAGDSIFVKRGTYQEFVTFRNSGTAGNPIVLKNYGNDIVTIDAQNIRVYCIYSELTDFINVIGFNAINANNYIIKFYNCSNIRLENCRTSNSTKSSSVENILFENTIRKNNYTIKNCYANNGSNGIAIMGMTTNMLIQNCEVVNSYYSGVTVTCDSDTISSPHKTVIDGVYSHNNGRSGIGTRIVVDVTIRNSHLSYNDATGIQIEAYSYNSIVEDNVCEYNSRKSEFETGIWIFNSTNSIVRRNIMRGNQTGLRVWSMDNFQAYYNLIINNNFLTDGLTQNTSGADFRQSSGTFYNNVLVGNCASNSKLGSIHVYPEGISNVTIKNNIVMNDRSVKDMDFDHVGESVVSSDFNLVYNNRRAVNIEIGTKGYTWSAYKTFTKQESHSVNADPKFISVVNCNFKLQSISPAINKGISIAEITSDFLGKTLSGLRDIGAYEF